MIGSKRFKISVSAGACTNLRDATQGPTLLKTEACSFEAGRSTARSGHGRILMACPPIVIVQEDG
jgi:hypothetical protein